MNVKWDRHALQPATVANQLLIVDGLRYGDNQSEQVYLVLGHAAPPLFVNSADFASFQNDGGALPVEVKGTFVIERGRAVEWWKALGVHLGQMKEGG